MRSISVQEFEARFDEVMALVEAGEPFALTRADREVAVLQRIEPSSRQEPSPDA